MNTAGHDTADHDSQAQQFDVATIARIHAILGKMVENGGVLTKDVFDQEPVVGRNVYVFELSIGEPTHTHESVKTAKHHQ